MNNRINKIHEKAFKLVYKDETNLFLDDLLKKGQIITYLPKKPKILSSKNI